MFDNGLVRFSTRQYRKIKKHSNNRDRFMHLTNYSVNKKSGAFEARTDGDMEAATGRCSTLLLPNPSCCYVIFSKLV